MRFEAVQLTCYLWNADGNISESYASGSLFSEASEVLKSISSDDTSFSNVIHYIRVNRTFPSKYTSNALLGFKWTFCHGCKGPVFCFPILFLALFFHPYLVYFPFSCLLILWSMSFYFHLCMKLFILNKKASFKRSLGVQTSPVFVEKLSRWMSTVIVWHALMGENTMLYWISQVHYTFQKALN